jgi:hypothetical protein
LKLCQQQIEFEEQIMSTRCATRSDFAIKLSIYDFHGLDDVDAERIMRDFRQSVEVPVSRMIA